MIRRTSFILLLALALATAGCNGPSGPSGPPVVVDGPHGGVVVPLSGNAGFAEILSKEADADGSRRQGRPPKTVVAYFLGPDKKTALSPVPTGVGVKIVGGDGATVPLSPAPDSKDLLGAARFASSAGTLDVGGRRAELSAEIGGSRINLEFRGLR